jgi:phage terminase large subunit
MNEHTIIVKSNACSDFYHNNRAYSFTNKLATSIPTPGDLVMAIESIQFPNNCLNFPDDEEIGILVPDNGIIKMQIPDKAEVLSEKPNPQYLKQFEHKNDDFSRFNQKEDIINLKASFYGNQYMFRSITLKLGMYTNIQDLIVILNRKFVEALRGVKEENVTLTLNPTTNIITMKTNSQDLYTFSKEGLF